MKPNMKPTISSVSAASGNGVTRALTSSPLIAVTLYLAVTGGLLLMAGLSIADVIAHRQALAQTSDLLDQLRGRKGAAKNAAALSAEHPGTPFLEGPTVTVAGANLLQRVATAVGNVGGSVQSSQVDVTGAQTKDGFVGLVVSCELEQPALQKVLYDLEAGMPFLFVDQLDVQVPQTTAQNDAGNGRVRVILGVSGQWQAGK
ncbi:type II secretion system protein GspM [Bradyrhizobium sp. GCM10027634]|uniref:type II secretion system protein GspM n=1 Tax=unclassified Bradyrhizobium TaxID=2631580 RepID=UPI00263B3299|nr:type II secretion system protein GspM [Bradyrhizobium sp. WYCCWR 12677]MDN5006378.1 type II secretion system protein GspM [Bradyrhizobium sp. WYCCWR 12677]